MSCQPHFKDIKINIRSVTKPVNNIHNRIESKFYEVENCIPFSRKLGLNWNDKRLVKGRGRIDKKICILSIENLCRLRRVYREFIGKI